MISSSGKRALGLAFLLLAQLAAQFVSAAPAPLPSFRIDLRQTSVSGLSSGGYMAVQFGVAYSSLVQGVGVIAGGPFYCARGDVLTATTICSCTALPMVASCRVAPGATDVDMLVRSTAQYASQGKIDPIVNMAQQRIWLFSGKADSVVPQPVMDDLYTYYRRYIEPERIQYKNDLLAEHAMPTENYGNPCVRLGDPYLNRCRFDAAGALLMWIYSDSLHPPRRDAPAGRMIEFDQRVFIVNRRPAEHGLADSGYVYVPAGCEGRPDLPCRVHVAFHGCVQNFATVGDKFILHAGYNRWADVNRLVVLYPQTSASLTNPRGCWNWFDSERNDPDYATRQGYQMKAVRDMLDRLAGVPPAPVVPRCFSATNDEHIRAGRAHLGWLLTVFANGSDDFMGLDSGFFSTTLRQVAPNFFEAGRCP